MRQWSTQAKIDIPSDVATDPVISYDLVKSRIKTLVRRASRERATAPIQDYFHTLLTLESALLADYFLQDLADSIVDSQDMKETVRQSQELFGELEVNLENSLISAYQSMHDKAQIFIDEDSLAFNYLVRYRQLAKVEAEFAALQPHDRVAFVGAGAFPISAMEFAKLTGCRVDGLDILEDAVAVAKKVISDFGLQKRLRIFKAAGQDFDYSDYSVVFVGVLAEPKPDIMQQISRTADPSVRVFCRTTHGLRKMIYRPTRERSLRPYRAVHAHAAEGFQTLSTLALAAPGV